MTAKKVGMAVYRPVKDLIAPDGAGVLAAFVALGDRGGDDPFDEGIAHIGQGGIAVQPGFVFHLDDAEALQSSSFSFSSSRRSFSSACRPPQ